MRHLNLSKQLFWMITAFILTAASLITYYLYTQTRDFLEVRAYSRATTLQNYFMSMRRVYHQQFLSSGMDLNDSTVGFLPAHASSLISDEFVKRNSNGISIRNVSDQPRNPRNRADAFEREAMRRFSANPDQNEYFTLINQQGKEYFFYASPIRIEPYCIQCHGQKDEVLPYIARRYDQAYGYRIGDVRGATSIKIPRDTLARDTMPILWKGLALSWTIILSLLGLIYYVIHEITRRDVESKKKLRLEVKRQTADLKEANRRLQHLFSILRTITDSNKILITTQSLEELIDQTAHCLVSNEAFASVKISLLSEGELRVRAFYGVGDEQLLATDLAAFEQNTSIILTDFTTGVSDECARIASMYGFTAVYATALKHNSFATEAFGVMSICTTQEGGFTEEEKTMIDELAGDLGFAINSFFQKEDIIKLSYYDPITELPNRHLLMEHVARAMQLSMRSHRYGGLLLIDLDNFKTINDLKGHNSGDNVLRQMAKRLRSILRQADTVARFGGDEFIVLLEDIGSDPTHAAQSAQSSAQKILDITKDPFDLDGEPFYLTASIGVVLFDGEKTTTSEVYAHADSAMYAAKNSGRNTIRFYDALLQEKMANQAKMVQELRAAVDMHALYLVYQEQVDRQGNTVGVEALIRWEHPEKGVISPSEFIPLAEESGIIVSLGGWILQEAIAQISRWNDDPIKQAWRISVNVSPRQFEQTDFIPHLKMLLVSGHIDPSKLRLELTEGLLIRDAEQAMHKIHEIKNIGVSLSIDDFGTGYSSLSYLKHLPIDELKIDQSFVKALPQSGSDETIIRTMITIAEAFGLEVIAEGVETQEQFETLKALGCNLYQGYLFSRPQKADFF